MLTFLAQNIVHTAWRFACKAVVHGSLPDWEMLPYCRRFRVEGSLAERERCNSSNLKRGSFVGNQLFVSHVSILLRPSDGGVGGLGKGSK